MNRTMQPVCWSTVHQLRTLDFDERGHKPRIKQGVSFWSLEPSSLALKATKIVPFCQKTPKKLNVLFSKTAKLPSGFLTSGTWQFWVCTLQTNPWILYALGFPEETVQGYVGF